MDPDAIPDTIKALQIATINELLEEFSHRVESAMVVYRITDEEKPMMGVHGDISAVLGMVTAAEANVRADICAWLKGDE